MRARAFSLLEVMVTLGVVAMLAGSVFAFMLDLMRDRVVLEHASRDSEVSSAIVERLEGDLLAGAADVEGEAGIAGDASSLRIVSRAVVTPTKAGQRVRGDALTSELRYIEGAGRLEARRFGAREDASGFEIVSERVQAFRLRYFDGRRWVSAFDSMEAGGLPVAIEVAAWFGKVDIEEGLDRDASDMGAVAPDVGNRDASLFLDASPVDPSEARALPAREPDLLRVIVVPDGPIAAWRSG